MGNPSFEWPQYTIIRPEIHYHPLQAQADNEIIDPIMDAGSLKNLLVYCPTKSCFCFIVFETSANAIVLPFKGKLYSFYLKLQYNIVITVYSIPLGRGLIVLYITSYGYISCSFLHKQNKLLYIT